MAKRDDDAVVDDRYPFEQFGWNTPEHENPIGSFQRPLLELLAGVGKVLCDIRDELRNVRDLVDSFEQELRAVQNQVGSTGHIPVTITDLPVGDSWGDASEDETDERDPFDTRPSWARGKGRKHP